MVSQKTLCPSPTSNSPESYGSTGSYTAVTPKVQHMQQRRVDSSQQYGAPQGCQSLMALVTSSRQSLPRDGPCA